MTGPSIEALVSERGIFAYCRTCRWLNGPFYTQQAAQKWGEDRHTSCAAGDLLTCAEPPQSDKPDPANRQGRSSPSSPEAERDG